MIYFPVYGLLHNCLLNMICGRYSELMCLFSFEEKIKFTYRENECKYILQLTAPPVFQNNC